MKESERRDRPSSHRVAINHGSLNANGGVTFQDEEIGNSAKQSTCPLTPQSHCHATSYGGKEVP
jgi:hypothetical protein